MKETLSNIEYKQASSEQLIQGAYQLMKQEFMSQGGNLKDKSPEEMDQLLSATGQLWVAHINGEVIATFTLEAIPGANKLWLYINNGVVAPHLRRQSSGVMDQLIKTAIEQQTLSDNYIVISVVWGIFERLGFSQVSTDQLEQIDPHIAKIIKNKLRPEKQVYIGIKTGIPI